MKIFEFTKNFAIRKKGDVITLDAGLAARLQNKHAVGKIIGDDETTGADLVEIEFIEDMKSNAAIKTFDKKGNAKPSDVAQDEVYIEHKKGKKVAVNRQLAARLVGRHKVARYVVEKKQEEKQKK